MTAQLLAASWTVTPRQHDRQRDTTAAILEYSLEDAGTRKSAKTTPGKTQRPQRTREVTQGKPGVARLALLMFRGFTEGQTHLAYVRSSSGNVAFCLETDRLCDLAL